MLTINDCSVSCGVNVIGGETHYQTAESFVADFFAIRARKFKVTQYIFTHCTNPASTGRNAQPQEDGRCMGDKIEEFVREHNLGIITRSQEGTNPHHGERPPRPSDPKDKGYTHKICVWVWTIPDDVKYSIIEKEVKCPNSTELKGVAVLPNSSN